MISKLEVTGLSYSYHSMDGETQALSDISFQVEEGEFIAVVGPSGCGKSTLLSIICGLIKPDQGTVRIDGEPVEGTSPKLGYMLQRDHLFEWRSIFSNASLGLEIQKPFSALDYQTRLSVCDDISSIIRGTKKTAVLITHDLSEAVSVADRIIILSRRPGRIKAILPVKFSKPGLGPLSRRNAPEFSGYFKQVWNILENREESHEQV